MSDRLVGRDDTGHLVPLEPFRLTYLGTLTGQPGWEDDCPDIWECDEHPEWSGEDFPESEIAVVEAEGHVADARGVWESQSIQAHVELHGMRDLDGSN